MSFTQLEPTDGGPPDSPLASWFRRWASVAPHSLAGAAPEPPGMADLLALADDETRALWDGLHFDYTFIGGDPRLCAEIARQYDNIAADEVIVCAGAEEALYLALRAILRPGDHAVAFAPAYPSLHDTPRIAGASVTLVPLDESRGWTVEPEAVRLAMRPGTRVVVANVPHNPTGALMDAETFRAIATMAEDAGAVFLCDEAFRGLEHDPDERLPAAADVSPTAVSVGGVSKPFGLAGLRIGWLATRDGWIRSHVRGLKGHVSKGPAAPSEVLALIALRAREALLRDNRERLARHVQRIDAFMAQRADRFAWVRPRAGAVAFPRLLRKDVQDFAADLAREAGVMVLPGPSFAGDDHHFRLGFGGADFPEVFDRFEAYVDGDT